MILEAEQASFKELAHAGIVSNHYHADDADENDVVMPGRLFRRPKRSSRAARLPGRRRSSGVTPYLFGGRTKV